MKDKQDKTNKPDEKKTDEVLEATQATATDDTCSCGQDGECCKKECANCEEMKKQVEEFKTKYLRAIADYQNYERRVQVQRVEWATSANKNMILKLLAFLDDLERAELFVKDPNLAHIKESFSKVLKAEGLAEIEVMGKQYDPYTAEVIDIKEDKEDNVVLAVLRKGYTFNGQLLRVAQVTVSKKVA